MSSVAAALALTVALQTTSPAPPQPPADEERDQPITRLFENLARDFVRLPSPGSGLILATGSGVALALLPLDDNLGDWAGRQEASGYTPVGRVVGDGWVQAGAALATYGTGLLSDHRPTIHIGSDLIRGQALNAVITRVTKVIAGRKRPGGSRDSLPSGHTSAAFTSAAVLGGHFGWKVGVPAYAMAGFIGWTRVRDHAHWPTDVVIGATVGAVVGHTVTRGHARSWAVVPSVSATGVAIVLIRLK